MPPFHIVEPGDVLDLGPLGAVFEVRRTAAETDGTSFEMEWELAPETGGTPVHVHPHAIETYEVLEGRLDVLVDGTWRTLTKGDTVTVAENVPHTFRNASPAITRVYNTHQPAMRFEEYFEGLARLVERGLVTSSRPGLKAMLHLAIHMTGHPEEIQAVKPPQTVMRMMAAVGKALGYRV